MSVTKLLYRPSEAAEALGVSRSKVYELIALGDIPSVRIGSSIRVPVALLHKLIEQRATGNGSPSTREEEPCV